MDGLSSGYEVTVCPTRHIWGDTRKPGGDNPPFGLKELSMKKLFVVFSVCFFLLLALAFSGRTVLAASMSNTFYGKYENVKKTVYAPNDRHTYGDTYDRGYRNRSWYGRTTVPAGYWVYAYPYWYVYSNKSPSYDRMNNRHNNDRHNNDRNNNSRRNYNHGMNYDQGRNWSWSWGWSQ
jgi:hypothetical protein